MENNGLFLSRERQRQIAYERQQRANAKQKHLRSIGINNQTQKRTAQPRTTSNFAEPTVSNFATPQISNFTEATVPLSNFDNTPQPQSNFVGQNNTAPYSNFVACGNPEPKKKTELDEKNEKMIGYGIIGFLGLIMLFFIYTIFFK